MTSTLAQRTQDVRSAHARRKPVMRVPTGARVVYTSGNRKRLVDSFGRWLRTRAFRKTSEADAPGVVELLRQSRDCGFF